MLSGHRAVRAAFLRAKMPSKSVSSMAAGAGVGLIGCFPLFILLFLLFDAVGSFAASARVTSRVNLILPAARSAVSACMRRTVMRGFHLARAVTAAWWMRAMAA
ncbi:hypothetical protein IX30_07685 [Neisseria gonorrhoeae]|nr:hypothetical protein IX30_07685 [Neisseria gonorrhoeae]